MSIHGLLLPRAAAFTLLQSPLWEPQLQDQSKTGSLLQIGKDCGDSGFGIVFQVLHVAFGS